MTRDVQLIHRLLAKYKFVEPVEVSARVYLPKSQQRALKYCLKKTGDYSIWFGLVLFILFTAKRFGFSVSLVTSKVLVLISLAAAIAATSGGVVMVAHSHVKPVSGVTEPETPAAENPVDQTEQTPETNANQNGT